MNDSEQPTYLGLVRDVNGANVSVQLDEKTISGLVFIDGYPYRVGQVGSFIRIPMGYIDLFGIVTQIGAGAVPRNLVNEETQSFRWMSIELVGEADRKGVFQRGISCYPTIADSAHLVTEPGLRKIFGQRNDPSALRLGHIVNSDSIPALVDVNKFVMRHSALVGSTGTGKSTTVASLIHGLTRSHAYPSARIVVFDLHGEYSNAFEGKASVFAVNPDPARKEAALHLPYWALTFGELLPLILPGVSDRDRSQIFERVTAMKRRAQELYPKPGAECESVNADTPVPFSIHQLWLDLHNEVNATHTAGRDSQTSATIALELNEKGEPIQEGDPMKVIPPRYRAATQKGPNPITQAASSLQIRRPLESFASKLRDPRFDFLFKPGALLPELDGKIESDLDEFLKPWLAGDNPISILDLSGIPPNVLNQVVAVLLRLVYDALFWARNLPQGGRERPLLVVLEEAHLYLNSKDGPATRSVQRIVKEGRKYGIGAMVVSQRPSEIDPTILSQCGTVVAMRVNNREDRNRICSVAADNLTGLLAMLPILRTGEAIILGEAVQLPTRVCIEQPPPTKRPAAEDPLVYSPVYPGGWNKGRVDGISLGDVVEVWRLQRPFAANNKSRERSKRMERVYLDSSAINSVGYDANDAVLEIEFTSGRGYQYFDVPEDVYQNLITADSAGRYFKSEIEPVYTNYYRL